MDIDHVIFITKQRVVPVAIFYKQTEKRSEPKLGGLQVAILSSLYCAIKIIPLHAFLCKTLPKFAKIEDSFKIICVNNTLSIADYIIFCIRTNFIAALMLDLPKN